MPTDGQLLNNRYRLIARIAAGGMAVVYKAQDTMLSRIVAIKIMRESFAEDPSFQARFQREARAAANLSHPNVVTVHDFGLDGDKQYIVMEYVEGSDLKQLIRQGAPFSPQRVLDVSIQVCAAVGAAHRAGLVHCDVKPQNVIVTPEGRAKVTDFGIARALSAASASGVTTGVWGTPHYFSPEQASGQVPTPASDVYSIGVIMYEMLTGRLPFEGDNQQQLAVAHVRELPPPISKLNPTIPAQLEQIVMRALVKEPSQRYRHADQLGRLLYEYQRGSEQATGYQPSVSSGMTVGGASQHMAGSGGFDWSLWLLAAVATILVIGLIPLTMLNWQKYYGGERIPSTPTLQPTATVTAVITDPGQQTNVPQLTGLKKEEVDKLVAEAGLHVTIKEERADPKTPAGTVLEQSPPPGTPAKRGDTVNIVLSKGLPIAPVPIGLLGLQYDEAYRKELEKNYGWVVKLDSQWSQVDPKGRILKSIPPPGASLTSGMPLTLVLSSGSIISLNVNLGNVITLDSAEIKRDTFRPGETFQVTFNWRSRVRSIPVAYKIFVHLIGPNSPQPVTQIDGEPLGGNSPTTTWSKDALVADWYAINIPGGAPRGKYILRVGMYPANTATGRLPVLDPGKTTADQDSILIKELIVEP